MKILQALESLIFEIFSILAFWPKTLYMVITKPVKTIRLMDEELERKGDFRFNKIMSPLFFALLPMVTLCYVFQLICAEFSPMDIINDWTKKQEVVWVEESRIVKALPQAVVQNEERTFILDTTASAVVKGKISAGLPAVGQKTIQLKPSGRFAVVQKSYEIENKDLYPLVTGLLFLAGPFFLGILLILLLKEPLSKENLQKKFFHQCLIGTPLNVFFYFPISAMSGGSAIYPVLPDALFVTMCILLVPTLLWYWVAETWYIRHYLGKEGLFGAAITFGFYILNIFAFGSVGILLAFLM